MLRGKERIPKMKPKELRKLRKKLVKTRQKTWKAEKEAKLHLWATQESLERVWKLESRVRYWIGKEKALLCPAYKHTGRAEGKCMVHTPEWGLNMKNLFRNYCVDCKLTKKEALKKGTFNGVFGNSGT